MHWVGRETTRDRKTRSGLLCDLMLSTLKHPCYELCSVQLPICGQGVPLAYSGCFGVAIGGCTRLARGFFLWRRMLSVAVC